MHAIAQKCRPKHQVLVLKCYPRTTKGAVDVKPNSSELSYLLFYATSRKTKIQKVASFLEKKTASDVWRLRIGNVQVTLQILEALIEKNPKDLPLFAPTVLKILDLVLQSGDITMVESSIPTFDAFCANHDASTLFADQVYFKPYESVVRQYAALASTRGSPGKGQPSKPLAMRWRSAGLQAIKSVASSDALASVSGRQYDTIVPMILENLWTDNEDILEILLQRADLEEKIDSEKLVRRRNSTATVRTAETAGDTNPIALSGSATDVDKLAEEEVGVLAMQCLKQIFIAPSRSQIHAANLALLRFIQERVENGESVMRTFTSTGRDSGWALKMIGLVSRWAPVQDRYIILVTTMDAMVRTPMKEEKIEQHIVLAAMVGFLLRSDVNLIGLSVMDVLLSFLQEMKRLVQMPGDPTGTRGGDSSSGQDSALKLPTSDAVEKNPSKRNALLGRIEQCIGDLATHVYYTDQISDMISAILLRLKPTRSGSTANSSPQGENVDGAAPPAPSVENSLDDHHGESLFSLTVSKIAALNAVKKILLVANPRTKISGNVSLSRNRVPIQVWEGTQWLLRDPNGLVRKTYVDALLTWLERETTKEDQRAKEDASNPRSPHKNAASTARRAVSSASQKENPAKVPRSQFLALLHVAIYDNAVQWLDFETDIVLLHALLFKLASRLGINAVRYGLPMIFRLQEDIQEVETPLSKVRLGCMCHGYFWTLTEVFDFGASVVGRAIHNEIIRRRSKHFWIEGVHIPPPVLELVGTPGLGAVEPKMPMIEVESEALLPFDDRTSLVECICTGYQETSTASPPQSPASSPGRSFSHPILGSTLSAAPQQTVNDVENDVPSAIREQMLVDWSREAVIIAMQSSSKSASLNGSRTATTGTNRAKLGVNGGVAHSLTPSPYNSQRDLRPLSQPAAGGGSLAPAINKLRKSSVRSAVSPSAASSSSRGFVTSVDQLKQVLSGDLRPQTVGGLAHAEDDSSDSMVSYDMTPSELSFNPAQSESGDNAVQKAQSLLSRERKASVPEVLGPLNSHPMGSPTNGSGGQADQDADDAEYVPPVPPLPADLARHNSISQAKTQSSPPTAVAAASRPATAKRSAVKSRSGGGGEGGVTFASSPSFSASPFSPTGVAEGGVEGDGAAHAIDLQSLLLGINSGSREKSIHSMAKPPY